MNHLDTTPLNLYLDDALDAAARTLADTHLAACPTCQRELSALRALSTSFDTWRAEPIPHDISAAVITRLAARPAPALVSRWGAVLLGLQSIFVVLLVVWLAPMVTRLVNGLPFDLFPTFDWSGAANRFAALSAVTLPFPSFAPLTWLAGLLGIAVIWLVTNQLLIRSLGHSSNHTQEASQ